ncbi:NfeD family protein [Tautonia sociabilis]|uniref:NfeD-like C-terminal domain-containing protein n=1 Tax=Tautonia sociabilis TaxID=2080755 RepID=A0A432MBY4_9BACT|nr:NfeD family protein [Tautonia sociabilis]RUL81397.1 hypothetical protein TsocGM_25170 [Tautonia sociabilis]
MNADDLPAGSTARTATPLRPSGKVSIDGALVHARAEGEWFDAGQEVAILRADAFGLVVGRPGTTSLSAGSRPGGRPSPSGEEDEGARAISEGASTAGERYFVGLMAFAALGTFLGGVAVLAMALVLPPLEVFRAVPAFLVGGPAVGLGLFHLALLIGRVKRGIDRIGGLIGRDRSRSGP